MGGGPGNPDEMSRIIQKGTPDALAARPTSRAGRRLATITLAAFRTHRLAAAQARRRVVAQAVVDHLPDGAAVAIPT